MKARFRVPCPVWGERSQRAFRMAGGNLKRTGTEGPKKTSGNLGEGDLGELSPAAPGAARGPSSRPEGGGGAE